MNLHLYINAQAMESVANGDSPSLARLLGRGRQSIIHASWEALLCQATGISQQTDWPIAAVASQAEKWAGLAIEKPLPETSIPEMPLPEMLDTYWLQVDPVHFVLQRDYFTLEQIVALNAEESQALLTTLNDHFSSDGLNFLASADFKRWYLQLTGDPGIRTVQPGMVIGRETTQHMPQGAGARRWNRLLNEMQMLLFEHPVNLERERKGNIPVNSIWLSGGGSLPGSSSREVRGNIGETIAIFADNVFSRGLQDLTSTYVHAVPASAEELMAAKASNAWLMLEQANNAEEQWFLPLLQALRKNQIKQLTLYLEQQGQLLNVHIRPMDTWKFWRASQPIPNIANTYIRILPSKV